MDVDVERTKRSVMIRTPDQRLRVFVSSTLKELAEERKAIQRALSKLHLAPVMFESGSRPHPAQELYQAYLSQSHVFIGIYWQSYGWLGSGMDISGLEDEYNRSAGLPRLIYIKTPANEQSPALKRMLERIREDNTVSYKYFETPQELTELVENDLILLLTEYFETARAEEEQQREPPKPTPINIPIPRNPLIGREQELEAACSLILREDVALVTLLGPAGMGKSRLGIQIAHELRHQFNDGVIMVTLESIRDPELVVPTIAKALNISDRVGGLTLIELIKRHLCDKQMLLFLDNFEQVLPAAPKVAEILEACPRVDILVTSRAALHLRAEKEVPVPPLKVPPVKDISDLQPLTQFSAVQLFIQRCQAVKSDFQLTSENASAIAEICRQLDGLPLAIELAAARIKLLPPQTLLARLDHRFDVLRGGTKDLPERHQTMYSAIGWSYDLLNEDVRRLFRRLAVFCGGWTFEDAMAVCCNDAEGQLDILDGLETLVDNNLVIPPDEDTGELHCKMMGSIREYACDRLSESGEKEDVQRRHAKQFASIAEQADKEKFGSEEQKKWRLRLEAELDNMRAAMTWALRSNQYACVLRIATSLWRFWWTHGLWREGIQWLEHGLSGSEPSSGAVRAKALTRMGWMLNKVGETSRAITCLQESITLWRQINDQAGLALALSNLGGVIAHVDPTRAVVMLEEALKIRQSMSHRPAIYATMMNLALAEQNLGNKERAVELLTESLEMAREVKDIYSMVITLVNLGDIHTYLESYNIADTYFEEAEEIYQMLGDRTGLADVKRGRGRVALKRGDYVQALNLLSEACGISLESEMISLTLVTVEGVAFALQKLGENEKAARLLGACETIRRKTKLKRIPIHQAECEACVESIRDALDAETFNAAWNEGSLMNLPQAVTYAAQQGTQE